MLGLPVLYSLRTGDSAGHKVIWMYFCRAILVRGPGFGAKEWGLVYGLTGVDCLMLNTAGREKRS